MVKSKILEVVLQSRVMFQRMTDENGQDKKEPMCYILLREQGGSDNLLKDDFWCKVMGEMALQRFNPRQKVAVQLHFHAKKNGHKYMQRISIINVKTIKSNEKYC